jgi:transposase InsO family protein
VAQWTSAGIALISFAPLTAHDPGQRRWRARRPSSDSRAALQAQPKPAACSNSAYSAAWTNGTAERFNRTLINQWADARAWTSNSLRRRGLDRFLIHYNTRRGNSALGGHQ